MISVLGSGPASKRVTFALLASWRFNSLLSGPIPMYHVSMHRISSRVVALVLALAGGLGSLFAADVLHFRVEDTIQPASQSFIARMIAEAEMEGRDLVVMELDTPGGLLDSTR